MLGAILLTGYLGGAVAEPISGLKILSFHAHAISPVYFGVLIWFGLWLREPRLRYLIPLLK